MELGSVAGASAPSFLPKASHVAVALITPERHRKILIRQLVLELFAPFQQASTLIAQHIENARILELVGMLQAV